MNRDEDESILSAYLDGELGPAERVDVESALVADAELSLRLRELAAVRELVGGLSRPSARRDLSAQLCAQIGGRRPSNFTWSGGRALSRARVRVVGLSAAATVLLALTLAVLSSPPPGFVRGFPAAAHHVLVPSRPVALPTPPAEAAPGPDSARLASTAPGPRPSQAKSAPPPADPGLVPEDLTLRRMLDSPRLTRIFRVVDEVGGKADRQVHRMLETSPRIEARFGRITIVPGVVVDPKHPQRATVFVLALRDDELPQFEKDLRTAFRGRLEEDARPDPAVVTQLADMGPYVVLPGTPVTPLEPPSESSRLLAVKKEADDEAPAPEVEAPRPTPERNTSVPAPSRGRISKAPPLLADEGNAGRKGAASQEAADRTSFASSDGAPAARRREETRPTQVVLVWVTTADPVGPGP